MTLGEWRDILEVASYVVIILGVPAALHQYRRKTLREQQDREYGTYNALDEKYLEFQRLCFDHPQLDIFDIPDSESRAETPEEQKQELIAFTMLFSIFERAYLMYRDQSSEIKRRQWTGWLEYLTDFCARENFRRAWRISGNTFDTTFQDFVEATISRAQRTTSTAETTIRIADTTSARDVAIVTELVTNARIAGSKLASNELSYLLTTGPRELQLSSRVLLASAPDGSAGALIATPLRDGRVLLVSGVGIRGASTASVMLALLRALGSITAHDTLAADAIVIEATTPMHPVLGQSVPGMGGFREIEFGYAFPDNTGGSLWIWTTADTVSREDLAGILRQLIGEFYGPLRNRTTNQVTTTEDVERRTQSMLRHAEDRVPVRPSVLTLRTVASTR